MSSSIDGLKRLRAMAEAKIGQGVRRAHAALEAAHEEYVERQDCDLVLRRDDGSTFHAQLTCRFRAVAGAGPAVGSR